MRTIILCVALLVSHDAFADLYTIGTWNIAGNAINGSTIPRSHLKNQAKVISQMDADLLILTEVEEASRIYDLVDEIEELGKEYDARIINQTTNIDIGIIFKPSKVDAEKVNIVYGSDLGRAGNRNAVAFDVVIHNNVVRIYGVHLKSSGGEKDIKQRIRQSDIIADAIEQSMDSGLTNIMVIGDYNMFPRRDATVFQVLGRTGLRFITTESLCTGNGNQSCQGTHIQRNGSIGNMLDGFGISASLANNYQSDLKIIMANEIVGQSLSTFKRRTSDHLPIVASFEFDAP